MRTLVIMECVGQSGRHGKTEGRKGKVKVGHRGGKAKTEEKLVTG